MSRPPDPFDPFSLRLPQDYAGDIANLRLWFAGQALTGLLFTSDGHDWNEGHFRERAAAVYAEAAFSIASAMLAEAKKEKPCGTPSP